MYRCLCQCVSERTDEHRDRTVSISMRRPTKYECQVGIISCKPSFSETMAIWRPLLQKLSVVSGMFSIAKQ